jgi:ABC-type multidrug transport system fused ATPase/permease subunit
MIHEESTANRTWAEIEKGKRVDRIIKTVSFAAWSVTLVMVLIFAIMTGVSVAQFVSAAANGALPWSTALGVATPFLLTVGALAVLIATLSTVMIFLRMRTASLAEIQRRLAALEDMFTSGDESDHRRRA